MKGCSGNPAGSSGSGQRPLLLHQRSNRGRRWVAIFRHQNDFIPSGQPPPTRSYLRFLGADFDTPAKHRGASASTHATAPSAIGSFELTANRPRLLPLAAAPDQFPSFATPSDGDSGNAAKLLPEGAGDNADHARSLTPAPPAPDIKLLPSSQTRAGGTTSAELRDGTAPKHSHLFHRTALPARPRRTAPRLSDALPPHPFRFIVSVSDFRPAGCWTPTRPERLRKVIPDDVSPETPLD